jgi:hypothetical protein
MILSVDGKSAVDGKTRDGRHLFPRRRKKRSDIALLRGEGDSQGQSAEAKIMPVTPFPPDFRAQDVKIEGAKIHARVGGRGSAVVLLHGFGDTGDMWAPVAAALAGEHRVVVPDLRGMGLSSHPERGYDKKTQARDIAQVMDALQVDKAALVTHDIGNMVGYALAAQYLRASRSGQ